MPGVSAVCSPWSTTSRYGCHPPTSEPCRSSRNGLRTRCVGTRCSGRPHLGQPGECQAADRKGARPDCGKRMRPTSVSDAQDGSVTLRGNVHAWAKRDEPAPAALAAPRCARSEPTIRLLLRRSVPSLDNRIMLTSISRNWWLRLLRRAPRGHLPESRVCLASITFDVLSCFSEPSPLVDGILLFGFGAVGGW